MTNWSGKISAFAAHWPTCIAAPRSSRAPSVDVLTYCDRKPAPRGKLPIAFVRRTLLLLFDGISREEKRAQNSHCSGDRAIRKRGLRRRSEDRADLRQDRSARSLCQADRN